MEGRAWLAESWFGSAGRRANMERNATLGPDPAALEIRRRAPLARGALPRRALPPGGVVAGRSRAVAAPRAERRALFRQYRPFAPPRAADRRMGLGTRPPLASGLVERVAGGAGRHRAPRFPDLLVAPGEPRRAF